MKIITSNPVFQSGSDKSPSDMYYNNDGQFGPQLPSSTPTPSFPGPYSNEFLQSQQKKGLTWDKVKGAWTKAQESGLIDKGMQLFGGLFGKGKPKGKPPISTGGDNRPPAKKKDEGMSTTTIVLIGVGVLVAGFAIYKLSKK
jgi:hypothetical protein